MLVAAPGRWDEACFAIPAMRALRSSGMGIGVLCHEDQRELWETIADVEVITRPAKAKARALASMLDGGWKASLAWENDVAAEAFERAGIPRRLGPERPGLRRRLTDALDVCPGATEHRVRHYLGTIEALGIGTIDPAFFAPAALDVTPQAGTVLLSPESDFGPSYEWPAGNWETIAAALAADGHRLTVAGISNGSGIARRIAKVAGDIEYFDADPLAGTLPLLAVHQVVLAADGSLPHLAALAGSTCVTLFGPGDPAWKRPLGRRHRVVRRHVECAPCLLAKCPLDHRCQRELETQEVLAAVRSALA